MKRALLHLIETNQNFTLLYNHQKRQNNLTKISSRITVILEIGT